jgi:hypothetical protein
MKHLAPIVLSTVLLGASLPVADAHAQATPSAPAQLRLPKPVGEPKATPITSILTAIVVGGIVVVATLLPSKRGHQD